MKSLLSNLFRRLFTKPVKICELWITDGAKDYECHYSHLDDKFTESICKTFNVDINDRYTGAGWYTTCRIIRSRRWDTKKDDWKSDLFNPSPGDCSYNVQDSLVPSCIIERCSKSKNNNSIFLRTPRYLKDAGWLDSVTIIHYIPVEKIPELAGKSA